MCNARTDCIIVIAPSKFLQGLQIIWWHSNGPVCGFRWYCWSIGLKYLNSSYQRVLHSYWHNTITTYNVVGSIMLRFERKPVVLLFLLSLSLFASLSLPRPSDDPLFLSVHRAFFRSLAEKLGCLHENSSVLCSADCHQYACRKKSQYD